MRDPSPLPSWFWLLLVVLAAALLAVAWWDWAFPDSLLKWWQGEQLYPYTLRRLKWALILSGSGCLVLWGLGGLLASPQYGPRIEQASLSFCLAFAVLPLFARYAWHPLGVQPGSSVWTYLLVTVTAGVAVPVVSRLLRLLCTPFCRRGWVLALVCLLVVLYAALFGSLSVARHNNFRSHALDLGTMEQAAWNTLHGRPLERTPLYRDPADGSRYENRLLDAKLELILLPLSLLYGLGGDVRVLLWVQTVVLAAGALPLYWLHRDLRRAGASAPVGPAVTARANVEALLLSAAYLVYLPLHYVQMADLHPSALMVPLLIGAWRAMRLGRWRAYYSWLVLAFSCRIDAAFCALGLGLLLVLWRPKPLFPPKPPRRAWLASSGFHGLLTLVVAAAWLALDLYVVVPLVRSLYGSGAGDLVLRRFGALGNSPLNIARSVFSHPFWVLSLLAQRDKLQALFDLLVPAGMLSLLGPWVLAPGLPVLLINLLAGSTWQQSVHAHYMAPVIPFIWVAVAEGIVAVGGTAAAGVAAAAVTQVTRRRDRLYRRLVGWLRWAFQGTHLAAFALLCSLLVAVVFSPYPPGIRFRLADYWSERDGPSSYRQAQRAVVAAVPEDASVCAQSDLYPHLARRRDASLFPYCRLGDDETTEYVILDLDASSVKSPLDYHAFYDLVTAWLSRPDYGVAVQEGGMLLLQQGASRETLPKVLDALDAYGREFYRVTYVEVALPAELDCGDLYRVPVTLRNDGSQTWQSRGQLPVRLSYRWWTESGALLLEDSLRTDLPHRVEPGHEVRLRAQIDTPCEPGRYVLEWDLVREGDAWFGDMGAAMLQQEVVIR